jgi:hypothetical protein
LSRLTIVCIAASSVRRGRASFDEAFEGLLGDPDPTRPDPDGGQLASINPVANGLLIDLQVLGDLSDGEEVVLHPPDTN